MGFWSGVSNFVSSAVSIVTGAASVIGSALSRVASTVLKLAGNYFPIVAQIVEGVGRFIQALGKDDSVEEIGYRATLSDKKPDYFDSIQAYIDHLNHDIQIDKEKLESSTKIEKMAYQAIGASVTIKAIEEKKGFEVPIALWVSLAKLGMQGREKEIDALLDAFKDELKQVVDYTNGQLAPKQEIAVGDKLTEFYQAYDPNMPASDVEKKVMAMEISKDKQ